MVPGAAPGAAAPLEDDVLGAQEDPDVSVEAPVDGREAQAVRLDEGEAVARADDPAGEDRVDADAARDVPVGGALEDVRDAAVLADPPVDHHRHPVAEGERLDPVVGDDDGRDAEPQEEGAQLPAELLAGRRVERRERARRGGGGPGDGAIARARATRCLCPPESSRGPSVAEPVELQERERLRRPLRPLGGARMPVQAEGDVLAPP